jgi:hypothetical protein
MLEIIGALLMGAICVIDVTVLIGSAELRPVVRYRAFAIAAVWTSILFAIGAAGGFAQGATGPVPAPVFAFLILMIGGLVAFFRSPAFRKALLSVPLAGLIGINACRIGGVDFLILHSQGKLAAPFAISAGWGDVITGLAAIPLAFMALTPRRIPRGLLLAWTSFGTLDLLVAIILGALSAPGTPFRIFTEEPGTAAMGTLPWVVIPTLLVPLYLMTHLAIAVRLRSGDAEQGVAARKVDNERVLSVV